MKKNNLTYENSGVNIKAADNFVKYISSLAKKRRKINNYQNIGGFGSITSIPKKLKNPKLLKKIKRYYQNEVNLTVEDPDADYNTIIECIAEDLAGVV